MDFRPQAPSHFLRRQRNNNRAGSFLVIGVFMLGPHVGHCSQVTSNQLYEGLKVAGVDLVAQPQTDVEVLRPLVTQKAGQSYSAAEIQKTLAALEATKKFTSVDVEVRVEAEGLRVRFLLEPVYYVGTILFPGAAKAFSYTRLFQAVNYPAQEPYEAARADQGAASLRRWLAQQGYFAAQVKVEMKMDAARKLADISTSSPWVRTPSWARSKSRGRRLTRLRRSTPLCILCVLVCTVRI